MYLSKFPISTLPPPQTIPKTMSIPPKTSKYTPIILSLSLFLLILPFSKSDDDLLFIQNSCSDNKLSPNTDYQTNLNTLITTLTSTNATSNPTGLFSTTVGNTTNSTVYGLLLCYGDQNATTCHDCATTAKETATTECSNSKGAIIWYDACMLRYSSEPLLGKMELSPWGMVMDGSNIQGNRTWFTELVRGTVNELAVQAGSSKDRLKRKLATKVVNFTSSIEVHVLAQCTPDIHGDECTQCLTSAGGNLMLTKQFSQSSLPSCTVKFFTQTVANVDDHPNSTVSAGKNKVSAKMITSIVVPIIGVISIMAIVVIYLFRIKRANKYNASSFSTDLTTVEGLQFPLHVLQYATNNFSEENKLGTGGFGAVYKGTLKNGQEIAVKRLFMTSGQGIQDFKNEILLVAKLQHRNLVRLFGFCFEQNEKLLVYENLANKSLDHFIYDPQKQGQIDWRIRYQIIIGIARGMLYLHEDSRHRVIHRDLKASNILLDAEMNPKIADFGMARIFGMDQTHGSTNRVVGTYGYMPPEYAMHGMFSIKSDVYSFGVLTLEIISGKMISDFTHSEYIGDLLSYAWQKWREEKPLEFVDKTIRETCIENEVMRCLHIGLLCVQHSKDERPTMAEIVQMLDNYSTPISMPPDHQQPTFFIQTRIESGSDMDRSSTHNLISWTTNDASISNIEPR